LSRDNGDLGLVFVRGEPALPPVVCRRILPENGEQMSCEQKQEVVPGEYLQADTISMGRAPLNDVQLREAEIALFHLRIEKQEGFIIRKIDRNPIYLNGDPVEEDAVLSLGDVLSIGSYLFVVVKGFAHTRRG